MALTEVRLAPKEARTRELIERCYRDLPLILWKLIHAVFLVSLMQ